MTHTTTTNTLVYFKIVTVRNKIGFKALSPYTNILAYFPMATIPNKQALWDRHQIPLPKTL